MKIEIRELNTVVGILCDHLIKNRGITEIEVEQDYYWNVPSKSLYKVDAPPDDMDIGSLSEDYHDLQRVLSTEQPPLAYHLVAISSLFRYVGESLSEVLAEKGG